MKSLCHPFPRKNEIVGYRYEYTSTDVPEYEYTSTDVPEYEYTSTDVPEYEYTSTDVPEYEYTSTDVPEYEYTSTDVPEYEYDYSGMNTHNMNQACAFSGWFQDFTNLTLPQNVLEIREVATKERKK